MTNMAIFFMSVALLPVKITEKNGYNGNFESVIKQIALNNFMKKCHDNPLLQCQSFIFIENFK